MTKRDLSHDIPDERERSEILIEKYIVKNNDLLLHPDFYEDPKKLYPKGSYPNDEKFRVRQHKSRNLDCDPHMLEVLVPTVEESGIFSVPFFTISNLEWLAGYYKRPGVYIFYGPSANQERVPLYIGESRDLWSRILEHLYGKGNTKKVTINGKDYSPYKYFRWVEFFDLDSANHRKLLEQTLIAVKKPFHNYYSEERSSYATTDYEFYLKQNSNITTEIISYPMQDWDYLACSSKYTDEEYYLKKYKRKSIKARNCDALIKYIQSFEEKYNLQKWKEKQR